jgi:hypothetical protein
LAEAEQPWPRKTIRSEPREPSRIDSNMERVHGGTATTRLTSHSRGGVRSIQTGFVLETKTTTSRPSPPVLPPVTVRRERSHGPGYDVVRNGCRRCRIEWTIAHDHNSSITGSPRIFDASEETWQMLLECEACIVVGGRDIVAVREALFRNRVRYRWTNSDAI